MDLDNRLYYSFDYSNSENKADWQEKVSNLCLYFLKVGSKDYKVVYLAKGDSVRKIQHLAIRLFAQLLALTLFLPLTLTGIALLSYSKSHLKSSESLNLNKDTQLKLNKDTQVPDFKDQNQIFDFYNKNKNDPQLIECAIKKILNTTSERRVHFFHQIYGSIEHDKQLDRYSHLIHQYFSNTNEISKKMEEMQTFKQFGMLHDSLFYIDVYNRFKTPINREEIHTLFNKCLTLYGIWTPECLTFQIHHATGWHSNKSLAAICYIYLTDEMKGPRVLYFHPISHYLRYLDITNILEYDNLIKYLDGHIDKDNSAGRLLQLAESLDFLTSLIQIYSPTNYIKIIDALNKINYPFNENPDFDPLKILFFLIIRGIREFKFPEEKEKLAFLFRAIWGFEFHKVKLQGSLEQFLDMVVEHIHKNNPDQLIPILNVFYDELLNCEDILVKNELKLKVLNYIKDIQFDKVPTLSKDLFEERANSINNELAKLININTAKITTSYIGSGVEEFEAEKAEVTL